MKTSRMSSTGFATTLRVRPRSSRRLAAVLGLVHFAALTILPLMAIPRWLTVLIGVLVVLSLYRAIHIHVLLKGRRAIRELILETSGEVTLCDGGGREHTSVISAGSFVHPWVIILNLKLRGGEKRSLVLLSDSIPADVQRQLRIRLRLANTSERAGETRHRGGF